MHSKPKALWLQGLTCNGNSHSFLNHPQLGILMERFELLYHPHLPCTLSLEAVVTCMHECDLLLFEGAFEPTMRRAGVALERLLEHYGACAAQIVAVGSCASFGGVFGSSGGLDAQSQAWSEKIINLSGCPIHPEWLALILSGFAEGSAFALDAQRRPKALYAHLVHHGCTRNEYFEWKVDAKGFGVNEGCLYYDQGCRGVLSHGSCNRILWGGVSSKTRSGQPCFGCTESDFPRRDLFKTRKNMSIPHEVPLGVSKRAYLTLAGIAKTFTIERLSKDLMDD
ncbi:MAG: hydrogenase [Campylobacterales bacterium]|nr:hydrogenase [Campylobacterales bacterium]